MIPFLTVDAMRKSDAETIRRGVESKELMRRAGEEIFLAYSSRRENPSETRWGKTAVVCGTGNNAGDGYVLALCLEKAGLSPVIFLPEEKFSPDGKYYFTLCCEKKIPVRIGGPFDFSEFDTIADCLFGTGFHGTPQGLFADCIDAINASGKPVVSADINSGLAGDSGRGEKCVVSSLTVSVQFYQPGHFLGKAKDVIKEKKTVDIGILPYEGKISGSVIEECDLSALFPPRAHDSHKGVYGYVAILGGCLQYAGAAKLASLSASALRSGCGVVKLAAARSLYPAVAPYLLESTYFPIPDDGDGNMRFSPETLEDLFCGIRALACGMGWGKGKENGDILRYILKHYTGRLILDADGLNVLSELGTDLLAENVCESVTITPHPAEFSRLTKKSVSEILSDPIAAAENFAARFQNVLVLLKGTATVVTDGKSVLISDSGTPGMATAGSGDVLSGILAGLLGCHPASVLTVCGGAFLAGTAGETAAEEVGEVSLTAHDTVKALPKVIRRLCGGAPTAEEKNAEKSEIK